MRLDEAECWQRLAEADHGVLGTVHRDRGVDLVPVVFAVEHDARRIIIPVDTVKAKSGRRLQRLMNLESDARCSILVDQYDDDWTRLWWVRVHGRAHEAEPGHPGTSHLADRYHAYRTKGSIALVIAIAVDDITGWSAG